VIEILLAAVVGGVSALVYAASRKTGDAREAFAKEHGLFVNGHNDVQGTVGVFPVRILFGARQSGKTLTSCTDLELGSVPMPEDFSLAPEGVWAGRDWQIGHAAFDNFVRLGGQRSYLAYALGEAQRSILMALVDQKVRFSVGQWKIALSWDGHDLQKAAENFARARALAAHFSVPADKRAPALLDRATNDPLPVMRAAAVRALADAFPDVLREKLVTLRADDHPAVRLAVALASRDPADVALVPLDALDDAGMRELWDRCGGALPAKDRTARLHQLLERTGSEKDAVVYGEALLGDATAADALLLLEHALLPLRLAAVRWLGARGGVDAVAALRTLERSSVLARAQVKACRTAVAQIQARAGVAAAAGALSVEDDAAGAVSEPEKG
jgi:hypothetical protein